MEAMRESWTDERLDYFRAETAQRFDAVEQRLGKIEVGLQDLNGRFDALNRTLLQTGGGIIATLIAGIVSVVITQL
jgi:hypothetical protein